MFWKPTAWNSPSYQPGSPLRQAPKPYPTRARQLLWKPTAWNSPSYQPGSPLRQAPKPYPTRARTNVLEAHGLELAVVPAGQPVEAGP